jgi:hypothetical protein
VENKAYFLGVARQMKMSVAEATVVLGETVKELQHRRQMVSA